MVLSGSAATIALPSGYSPAWMPVGPAPITAASSVLQGSQPAAEDVGAVNALAVDPHNPAHVYAASVNGGIWETKNYTATRPIWTTTTDHLPSLAISSIAISPTNDRLIFAGTGNYASTGDGDVFWPGRGDNAAGVYRSCDGGATWTVSNPNGIFDGLRIRRVVPTSLNGGLTVLVATTDTATQNGSIVRGGVYRSDDGGLSWRRLSGQDNLPNTGVTDLAVNPANPKQVFAAVAGLAGGASPGAAPNPVPAGASGIYRLDLSMPRSSWQKISDGTMSTAIASAIRVELSISKAGDNPIWATTINSVNNNSEFYYSGVFRAAANTKPAWTSIAPPDVLTSFIGDGKGCMLADPGDANTLYVGGDLRYGYPYTAYIARYNAQSNVWTNITPNSGYGKITQIERNGGVATVTADQEFAVGQTVIVSGLKDSSFNGTFTITKVTSKSFSYALAGPDLAAKADVGTALLQFGAGTVEPIQTGVKSGPHADTRFLQIGVGGDLLLACDGGVYRCVNPRGSGSQVAWYSVNGSMQTTEFYQVALDNRGNSNPTDDLILGAAQDNGGSQRNADGTWVEQVGGDGVVVLADSNTDTRYFSSEDYFLLTVTGTNNTVSYPQGTVVGTKKYLNTAAGSDLAEELPFNVVFDLNQGDIAKGTKPAGIMLAGTKTLYVSTDKGETYTSIGGLGGKDGTTPLPVPNITGYTTCLAFGCAANPNAAYVCSGDGNVVFTSDIYTSKGGFGAPVKLPGGQVAQDIVIDPHDAKTAYVASQSNVLVTTDGGATWTSVLDNLGTLLKPYVLDPALYNTTFPNSRSISLFDNGTATKADDRILVGEPGGVFIRMVQPPTFAGSNTWRAFGAGTTLPNTLYMSLVYDAKSDVLVAGTLGRGAWLLKHASAAINTGLYNGTLLITGTSASDMIQIMPASTTRDAIQVIMNGQSLGVFDGIAHRLVMSEIDASDHVDVAPGVRLPVVINGVELNSNSRDPRANATSAPRPGQITDLALGTNDFLNDVWTGIAGTCGGKSSNTRGKSAVLAGALTTAKPALAIHSIAQSATTHLASADSGKPKKNR